MDAMCSNGLPLLSLDDNYTRSLISGLRVFRKAYQPYHGYLCAVICSFGILTNLINVVVLTKRQMRTSINVLLTGIAFCDMGTMASYLVYIEHFVLTRHDCNPFLYTYGWMCFLMGHVMLSIALHTTTLWLSVAMAFIRNMTLRQARIGSPWLRSSNTWKICVIIYSIVFALSVSSVFSNGILDWPEYFNVSCDDPRRTEFLERDRGYKAYTVGVPPENCLVFTITFWMTGTLFKIIPCLLLAVLIFSLLFTIQRAEKNRKALLDVNRNRAISLTSGLFPQQQQMHNSGRHHQLHQKTTNISTSSGSSSTADRTTIMLLMILGLSLLTELPQGAVSILSGIYVSHMQEYIYPNVADILDLLSLINSSVNFILYCIMSSKYRQAFWQVVLPRKVYIRWFIRPRQSARCRSRSRRRRMMMDPHHGQGQGHNHQGRRGFLQQTGTIVEEEPAGSNNNYDPYTTTNAYHHRYGGGLGGGGDSQIYSTCGGGGATTTVFNDEYDNRKTSEANNVYSPSLHLLLPGGGGPGGGGGGSSYSGGGNKSTTSFTSLPSLSRLSGEVNNDSEQKKPPPRNFNYPADLEPVNNNSQTASGTGFLRIGSFLLAFWRRLFPIIGHTNVSSTTSSRRRRRRELTVSSLWLIGCSCLCKCIIRRDHQLGESSRATVAAGELDDGNDEPEEEEEAERSRALVIIEPIVQIRVTEHTADHHHDNQEQLQIKQHLQDHKGPPFLTQPREEGII